MKALITGITGQDGAYLAQLLLQKGYDVVGCHRRTSSDAFWRLRDLAIDQRKSLTFRQIDVTDPQSCYAVLHETKPDYIYNLAAQSFVGVSFDQPYITTEATGLGALNMLEAMRKEVPDAHFYQASSSEMFGNEPHPQDEHTPLRPRSPYGAAKVLAHNLAAIYREAYGLHVSCGILFNHESPLRGEEFVTRKISKGIAQRKLNPTLQPILLGNLNSVRDWGHARDYVRGMWLMTVCDKPGDYVLATGSCRSIRWFLEHALNSANLRFSREGEGENETYYDVCGRKVAQVSPGFYRPAEVNMLLGRYAKANAVLSWRPLVSVEALCEEMVEADLRRLTSSV